MNATALATDQYELTMAASYHAEGMTRVDPHVPSCRPMCVVCTRLPSILSA
jgi:hypothetical protein